MTQPSDQAALENAHSTVVPKRGTAEYDEFVVNFEYEHGREFTDDDYMVAIKNGVHIEIGALGLLFCVPLGYFLVWDWYWWIRDRRAYLNRQIEWEPMPVPNKLIGTAIVLVMMAFCGSYLWTIAPLFVQALG